MKRASCMSPILCIVMSVGCLRPTDEISDDAGVPAVSDAGVDTQMDAGYGRVDCAAPARTRSLAVSELPDGCTHFSGSLFVVGRAATQFVDSDAGKVSSLVSVEGRVSFENVFPCENIRGLARLEHVSGAMDFTGGTLRSVSGASRLLEVGSLALQGMSGLEEIELSGLEVVHGDLYVTNNRDLRSLAGLRSLRVVEGKFIYGSNPRLSPTAVPDFIRRVDIDGGIERL
jgi:hypothetical protein